MKENKEKSKPQAGDKKPKRGIHDGHRKRMRERFVKTGFDGMQDHEVLEMLLYNSVYRKNTNELAHNLISTFGSLRGVLEASYDQLIKVKGVTDTSATFLKMMVPLCNRYRVQVSEKKFLNTADECGKYLCDYYSGVITEKVTAICLDSGCRVLGMELVGEGGIESCVLNSRRLVEVALKYPTTAAVIIAHNHPDGLALPSSEDVSSTVKLVKTMRNMGINIVDHFIIAPDDYVSLASSDGFKNIFKQV